MTSIPPLLPEETFLRVVRLARFDGLGVLIVAGVFSVLSAMAGDRSGAIVGLLIAGAGAIELHGVGLLKHGDSRGMNWLVGSQIFLLLTILGYCQFQLLSADLTMLKSLLTNEQKAQIAALGMSVDQFIQTWKRISVMLIAIATTLYHGGMTIYYLRRRKAVARALGE
jgi:hypothetical protein